MAGHTSFRRKIRRFFSRSEWVRRILGLQRLEEGPHRRGLILVQIDGLARPMFERAMAEGRMPFLARLHQIYKYRIYSHYSGVPSSTPAVQGELFYGKPSVVPAFSFYDKQAHTSYSMMEFTSASKIEAELQEGADPLLRDGSCYSNIYTGGAAEAHFCASRMGWNHVFGEVSVLRKVIASAMHITTLFRMAGLAVIELVLGILDFLRGVVTSHSFIQELKIVPVRIGICIIMREWITMGAQIDSTRGMPIIQLNFLGYDEQSHRRGPASAFAFWTLKGIDYAIERIWAVARLSHLRDYELWVYSDHGQEATLSYALLAQHSLPDRILPIVQRYGYDSVSPIAPPTSVQGERGHWLWRDPTQILSGPPPHPGEHYVEIRAKGPIGNIYFPGTIDNETLAAIAEAFVEEADVPIVLWKKGEHEAYARTRAGLFTLPKDGAQVLDNLHPFLPEVSEDLAALVHHRFAGDLIISGWRLAEGALSFPDENGAHAGPGMQETHGFALLPLHAPVALGNKTYLRPSNLRDAVFRYRRGMEAAEPVRRAAGAD